jgi:hypothetical protein
VLRRRYIAYVVFTMFLMYIASPWYFERDLYFNELFSLAGLIIFASKKFRFKNSGLSVPLFLLLLIATCHAVTSVFRADETYYYFRNMVIFYSMFAFFIGYYWFEYLVRYIGKFGTFLKTYLLVFLVYPVPIIFERFGMATLLPITVKGVSRRMALPVLMLLCLIYSFNYESLTVLILAVFFLFIYLIPSYSVFVFFSSVGLLAFAALFIYLIPYLTMDPDVYSHFDVQGIHGVMHAHPILAVDPNNTWRLVIWKQLLVDLYPSNILGIGFGTPALQYYPVGDYSKLKDLPYVLGAHNSFIYLAARLGLFTLLIFGFIYARVFKEYYRYRHYYYSNLYVLFFFSFFAMTIITLFNPVLESPIYATTYWLFLGVVSKVIDIRKMEMTYE